MSTTTDTTTPTRKTSRRRSGSPLRTFKRHTAAVAAKRAALVAAVRTVGDAMLKLAHTAAPSTERPKIRRVLHAWANEKPVTNISDIEATATVLLDVFEPDLGPAATAEARFAVETLLRELSTPTPCVHARATVAPMPCAHAHLATAPHLRRAVVFT